METHRKPLVTRVGTFVALLAVAVSVLTCQRDEPLSSAYPRSETLYVGGPQWGEPSSFNPLTSSPDWPVKDEYLLMYQTLLIYDPGSGKMEPLLAESYRQAEDAIEITVQQRARWSDGQPVTAADVKYTFDLGKRYQGVTQAPLWAYLKEVRLGPLERGPLVQPAVSAAGPIVSSSSGPSNSATPFDKPTAAVSPTSLEATAPSAAVAVAPPVSGAARDSADQRKVTFVLDPKNRNPLVLLDALRQIRIVPRHSIEPKLNAVNGDLDAFLKDKMDQNPVISGPYQLHSYSSEKIALVRRDDYWGNEVFFDGKKAVPKFVIHPVYKSNDHYSVALQQGRLDASSSFIPRIWLKRRKGVGTWFDDVPYFVSTSMPMMLINVAKPPLDDRHYRRAMAFSVNYKDIRELAVSGYSEPLQPGLILPFGPEARFFSAEDAEAHGASRYDPKRARAELAAGGYEPVFDAEGELIETRRRDGSRVPTVYIKSPTGWTDWESIVRIAVKGMREAGIDARERFIDAAVFWQATSVGDFDLIMNTPSSPPTPSKPWSRFEAVLTSRQMAPLGEKMYKNQGRFNDPSSAGYLPRIEELLTLIPTLSDEAALRNAYRELNILFMREQPTLPMVYRAHAFYEFSTRVWKGFPTAKNPYLPPQIPSEGRGVELLWHLERNATDL